MTLKELNEKYAKLQNEYGDESLDSILNGGMDKNPDVCFVFMNPTKRNIASSKEWTGLKSPWIGTKNIWKLFYDTNIMSEKIYNKIREIKGSEWTTTFAEEVYEDVKKHKYFITNLGKCTQVDARPLPDNIFKEYVDLLFEEFKIVNPKKIILFGNQVSSIVLDEKISVSQTRKTCFKRVVNEKEYSFYPVYYPVGNGIFNIDKSIEDIKWILDN